VEFRYFDKYETIATLAGGLQFSIVLSSGTRSPIVVVE
jgi:hypothetical protein